jgi:glyoxylase-like metal-dependent hydrolase (beta-lactamase superfamily II)
MTRMPPSASAAPTITITGTRQHDAWRDRLLPPVEQVRTDLWSVPVPMPDNPLRYVLVYVLAGDSAITLIDAGWESEESWNALCAGLTTIGAAVSDVRGCLVTHQHFDHIGLARRVREASGAWVGMHPADHAEIMRPDFRSQPLAKAADVRHLMSLGAPGGEALRLSAHDFDPRGNYVIPDRLIEHDQLVVLPGWSVRAVHTPGHTPGHLSFVEETGRLLFAGDHVLPRISPNISVSRQPDADALGDFLASLELISRYDVDEVLPAHEWRFLGLANRVSQLRAHHERRLSELLEVIQAEPGRTVWDLASELTWSRPWDQYDGFVRVTAVQETAAHAVHLMRRGLVVSTPDAPQRYRITG